MSEQPAPPTPRSTSAAVPLERGTRLAGRYELDAPIATGGMATVWRAQDTILTRPVAVKVLHAHLAADPEFVARFRREAVAAARLAHPSIVATYDTCDDPEAIVMELVEGRTLRDELDARTFLPPAEAVAIAADVCRALEVAHKAGIVHRDVKPANILLSAEGHLKVADFGIAKAARDAGEPDDDLPDLTAVGRMVGTAKYLAPEQVSGGEVDARTDVYAVGAVLYESVCGRPPFAGANDLATATARLHGLPERPRAVLRTVPDELDRIIMRALATDPDDRYPSAAALWADLQNCATDDAVPAPVAVDATAIEDAPSFAVAERSWLVPAFVVSVVAVALGLAWLLIGGSQAREGFLDLVDRVTPAIGSDDGGGDAGPVAIVDARAFDPLGDGTEHDEEAAFAIDGDGATAWTTERYDSRAFGGLKDGVGLVVDLGESRTLAQLVVESPDQGWSARVHVATGVQTSLEGWGEPVGSVEGASAGATTIDLADARGGAVLLWLTDLGDDPGVIWDLAELTVAAR